MSSDGPRRLFMMGLVTNLLNPLAAALCLSLPPQFIDPKIGHVLGQSLAFDFTQIAIGLSVNATIALATGSIAVWLFPPGNWVVTADGNLPGFCFEKFSKNITARSDACGCGVPGFCLTQSATSALCVFAQSVMYWACEGSALTQDCASSLWLSAHCATMCGLL